MQQLQHQEEFELSSSLLEKQNPLLYNLVARNEDFSNRADAEPRRFTNRMSKSTSSPTLKRLGMSGISRVKNDQFNQLDQSNEQDDLEVYVVLRNFQEFGNGIFHRLPAPLRDGLRDCGVCHYMTVFKQKDGTLTQFDFGPSAGGDIHLSSPGPLRHLMNVLNMNKSGSQLSGNKKKVDGQVRERRLRRLPEEHMFVGTTNLSLADIRAWNTVHAAPEYELHRSDCRHYTNALVQYTTGTERAAISALRHQLARSSEVKLSLGRQLIRLGQYVTDVANWERLCAIGNATTAAILTLGGQQTLARVGAVPLLQSVGAYSAKLIPAGARSALEPMKTYSAKLFQRPVYAMSTAAVASVASNEVASGMRVGTAVQANPMTPVVMMRSAVGKGVETCVRAAGTVRENVSRTQATAGQVVSAWVRGTRRSGFGAGGLAKAEVAATTTAAAPSVPSLSPPATVSSSPQKQPMFAVKAPSAEGQRSFSGSAMQQLALIATRR